ncbi:hypothetical protein [Sphingobacterium paucimobilis]|uniref:Uncharacterized protein n=1 Tax=Sphingobacterium paucimobilis HER1398 TaxID=1346330 RepID=U2HAF9_9SPHI|nr:hypothetical protein [Sphingobacterium paucimobilis]ERJ58726.1 hypothetical protein M472_08090 [Sphingobacterium paucimobilis HER1398]
MIETNTILISENPQSVYTLEMRDGKPFNGYEVTQEKLVGEFPFVNYYENGELTIKYAVDFIAKDQYEAPIEYTLKTTYEAGAVVDGNVYRYSPSRFLLTDLYLKGEKVGLTVDIFAMHYFNRITFRIDNDQLVIRSFDSKDEVKIYKKEGWAVADYYIDGQLVQQSEPMLLRVAEGTANSSSIFYYDSDNLLRQYNMLPNLNRRPCSDHELLSQFYAQFSFEYAGQIEDLLNQIDRYFTTATADSEEPIEAIFEHLAIPYTQETILGYVSFDEADKPHTAVLFRNMEQEKYQQFTTINSPITDRDTVVQLLEVMKQDITLE